MKLCTLTFLMAPLGYPASASPLQAGHQIDSGQAAGHTCIQANLHSGAAYAVHASGRSRFYRGATDGVPSVWAVLSRATTLAPP